ncbi:ABC transporter permease [Paenibacillus abyssi]|uniref:Peptide ABC transporter permease n=1 Tax=Paenibacillus abyssi TaxID=1340531 RepID=A0A917FQX8_9BACL|nr:ABC transporter permease [Paenibacillus abyssi]GGG00674.1 peptide ABC transporter permease [Paenibacillus abyssi]
MQNGMDGSITTSKGISLPRPKLRALQKILRNRQGLVAVLILLPMIAFAFLAPVLPLQDPLKSNITASLQPPSTDNLFGTDKLGRDIFSRTVSGMQTSMMVGIIVATITLCGGLLIGSVSGFFGGRMDRFIMGIVDIFLSFPSLLLAIGMVAIFGAGMLPVIIAISIADLPRAIRLQRSLVLSVKSGAFIDAARMVSAPTHWLLFRHIIPNTLAPMLVAASITAANAILTEASLSFLGLGITPPEPSLGNIIREGQMYLQEAWWISTLPGLVIFAIAISLHLLSDGIREVLDPRSKR